MIPGWLMPWWNWWAEFTALFEWTAIAAIATVLAVAVALCTTLFQERRVQRRVDLAERALRQGAVDTLRQGWIAIDAAAQSFTTADNVDPGALRAPSEKVERARRLLKLFIARVVDPKILIGLLEMDDHLAVAENELRFAIDRSQLRALDGAPFHQRLSEKAHAAELLFIILA